MNLTDIKTSVTPYLDKLSTFTTENEIKDFLVQEGIKAQLHKPTSCAIAEYVRRGSGVLVRVEQTWTGVVHPDGAQGYLFCDEAGCIASTQVEKIADHTVAMRLFVSSFDEGKYPELVA